MNRSLLTALCVVGALSLYLMGAEQDDALLAPSRSGDGARAPAVAPASPSTSTSASRRQAAPPAKAGDAATSRLLIESVTRWRAHYQAQGDKARPAGLNALSSASSSGSSSSTMSLQVAPAIAAWSALTPPPPPAPSHPAQAEALEMPKAPIFTMPWVGRFNDADGARAIARAVLDGPRATLVVKVGDVIEGQWRVDGIRERTMTLTYLPLNQPQTVAMR